jgi:hypothetical protein
MGSSGDIQIAGAAVDVCRADFAKTKDDVALFDRLAKRCEAKYAKSEGTMYRSFTAFCQLDFAVLLARLNRSPDT